MATALKQLPSKVLDETLADVAALYLYWRKSPHEHRALALQLQAAGIWKPPEEETAAEQEAFRESTPAELADFVRSFGK